MSTMVGSSGGGSNTEYDRVVQLIALVQQPEYLDRVRELRELETSSRDALEKATAATAEAKAASDSLSAQQQKLADDFSRFHAERDAHNADMVRREKSVQDNIDRFTALQKQTTSDSEALDRRQAQWEEAALEKQRRLDARESAVTKQEQDLREQSAALGTRVAAINKLHRDTIVALEKYREG